MATIKALSGAGWLKDADDNFTAINAELAYTSGYHVTPFVFDTAANDATSPTPVSNKTVAAHPLAVTIPDNAIVIGGHLDVIAAVTSATTNSTIAIHLTNANDVFTATEGAEANLTLAAQKPMAALGVAPIKLAAAKAVTVTVGTAALTDGKINGYIIWIEGA
jgi:hypothetical protein